jgi:transposase-like protein
MRKDDRRQLFSRAFKLAAVSRMAAGENVSALSRELGVSRKSLYHWRDRLRVGGPLALRTQGRMTATEQAAMQVGDLAAGRRSAAMPPGPSSELVRLRSRIADLERKVGRQELELDFFQQALRHIEEACRPSGVHGGTASTRSSKP